MEVQNMQTQWRAYIRDENGSERVAIRDTKEAAKRMIADARVIYRRCKVRIIEIRLERVYN